MNGAQVHIVVVNWNAGAMLRDCIASIAAHSARWVARVVVVDNGSTDGSANLDEPRLPLKVIRLPTNLGFAAASNRGATDATAPYILLLNPDTRLEDDVVARALDFMQSPEACDIGVCGIQLRDQRGEVQRHCARFPDWKTFVGQATGLNRILPRVFHPMLMEDFDHLSSRRVDHVIGAFYLIRREVWERLGGLDERFFVYLEDLDLSLRAAALGWGAYYLADASAFHEGGGTSRQIMGRRLFYALRSRILYAAKHFSRAGAIAAAGAALLIEPLSRLALSIAHRSGEEAKATVSAYRLLYGDLAWICRTAYRLSSINPRAVLSEGRTGN